MPQSRQLAAIMFTDIVGYTALMGNDEQKAYSLLEKNRTLHKPIIEQHNGRWIKELGDGVLASFNTVSDAVNAAIEIQNGCNALNSFSLRIGIHQGEVIFEDGDIFGDAVNIASRIQAIAEPGGIYISEAVQNIVANKKDIKTRFVKVENLKNVKDSVRIYAVYPEKYTDKPSASYVNPTQVKSISTSIAILPFSDMSSEHDQEYLGDGLAEELIILLSQIKELKVIGRTSSFSFKNKDVDLRTIGKILDSETILEGSVKKSGTRIRISAQLISAQDGCNLWSKRYDREMGDIFALQDDICANILEQLKLTLLEDHEKAIEKKSTDNLKAYELFLEGGFYFKQYDIDKAINCFKRALELDPNYADAWWYLGYANFERHGWLHFPEDSIGTATFCAEKAKEIDATNANAHFLTALIHFNYDCNWSIVESEIALGNNYTTTPYPVIFLPLEPWYRGMVLGDFEFAVQQFHKAVENDPLSNIHQFHLAQINLYGLRDYEKTRNILEEIIQSGFPDSATWRPLCLSYLFQGKFAIAEEYARRAYDESGGKGHGAANMIVCLAASGKKAQAEELYLTVTKSLSYAEFPSYLHAKVNASLGDTDAAFNYLDKAIANKDYWLFTLKYSPEWDLLRRDARFEMVLKCMKFPDG